MVTDNTAGLRVDIVSDVVCPWCIVGFKQFEQALNQSGTTAEIYWHPFELNPQMAEEGENLREHLANKYGTTPEQSKEARERLTAIGTDLGFTFQYPDDMHMQNTFRAHQLLYWAGQQGRQHEMKMALFVAFFTHNLNVNDINILAEVAASVGLDKAEALALLTDGRYMDLVRQEELFWTSRGIQGVPAMIFNQKHLVTGAQGVENYAAILQQLSEGAVA